MASPSEALQRLAGLAPRDLVRVGSSGRRVLHDLLLECRAAGLIAAPAGDNDVALLHALFDVALSNGLGTLVFDYVVEVCSDKYCTSSDALEAYLMDGECVKLWCRAALERAQSHLLQGLTRGLASLAGAGDLNRLVGRLAALVAVLEALARPAEGAAAPAAAAAADGDSEAPLLLARQLHQCAQVLEWASQHAAAAPAAPVRFASDAEWRTAVNKRRDAAAPATTFLHDLLQALAEQHGGGQQLQYPPASLERGVQGIFLTGDADAAAWRAKLALLYYYLLDAGFAPDPAAFMSGFGVPPRVLVEWQAYFLLDDALLGGQASLEEACRTLPAAATPGMSFKVVQALSALGCAGVALDVLRARSGAADAPDQDAAAALHEAAVGLRIRLSCDLISEAFMEAREHCSRVAPAQRPEHTAVLVQELAAWAAQHRELNAIIKLPFNAQEEQVLCQWLKARMAAGEAAALYLPLYFLVRGRLTEALASHACLLRSGVPASLHGKSEQGLAVLGQLLASAAQLLPAAQRALHILPGGTGGSGAAAPALQLSAPASADSVEGGNARSAALPIMAGLGEMEVWAAGQPALLAAGGCLSGSLLGQPVGTQDTGPEHGTAAALGPAVQAEGLTGGVPEQASRLEAGAQRGQQDWASWRARDKGEERPAFGQALDQGMQNEGLENEDDWETVLGGPRKGRGARSTKRARTAVPGRRRTGGL